MNRQTIERRTRRALVAFFIGLTAALFALPIAASAEGGERMERFDSANEAFAQRDYEGAERELEALITSEGFAPGALSNLGNARLAQGELGEAILAYERAALLAPHDSAIEENLRLARREAGVAAPTRSAVEEAAAILPARHWLLLGAIGLGLFVIACIVSGLVARRRFIPSAVGVVSGALTAVCAAALWIGALGVDDAIVVDGPATVRVSPFAEAEALFEAAEGETVEVLDERGDYVRIERVDGSAGWASATAVRSVIVGG